MPPSRCSLTGVSDMGEQPAGVLAAHERRRREALQPGRSRSGGEPLEQRRPHPPVLPGVGDEVGDFRSHGIVGVADVAGDADPLAGDGVQRHERLARAVVGVRELVQLAGAEVIDRLAEAAVARQGASGAPT